MANLRIKDLTDTQAGYSPDIVVAVDDSTFTNTKKMPIDAIYPKTNTLSSTGDFNPATQLLRTDNGSGSESKLTILNMLSDSDVINIIKLLGNTGWKTYLAGDVVRNSTKIDANTFVCNTISVLGFVTITGTIRLSSVASEGETLFTLPSVIPTATQNIHFNASDDSASDENYEFYIPAGSRTIKAYTDNSSQDTIASFCVTFPAI